MTSAAVVSAEATWCLTGCADTTLSIRKVTIKQLPFRIGRLPELHFSLPDPTISKQHAEFFEQNGTLLLRDLGSTNGTFVNGTRLRGETVVREGDLIQFANSVFRLGCDRVSVALRQTLEQAPGEWPLALLQFDRLLSDRMVTPYFQPILRLAERQVIGYESLGRSPLEGLHSPLVMFNVASSLGLECELSVMLRNEGIRVGSKLPNNPLIFVNTHPNEMQGTDLLRSLTEMRAIAPTQPIVLEIHEGAITDAQKMRQLRLALHDLHIGLAYDDFGAGQGRLAELIEVPPDYLKFDLKLIRNIHIAQSKHQQMLAQLVRMIRDFGIAPLAEGIEHAEEAETCAQLGFEYAQGFYFGRPQPLEAYTNDTVRTP
ncbi:MAG: EAL domain-containing protein [Planctomycetota bacterium]|nr:EAL domain-containing protein [Planctomycetota bacterium]